MSNRLKKILILILCLGMGILMFLDVVSIPCFFKSIFKIPCPGCGMTRAFKNILKFDFVQAFNYNILSIPLFLFFIFICISIIYDIIRNEQTLENRVIKVLDKYYIVAIILVLASFVVNIIRGI